MRPTTAAAAPPRRPLPAATVARLPLYLRILTGLAEAGSTTVSSEALARAAGVTPAQLRRDLSNLGSYGTRGVGYSTVTLVHHVSRVLGLTEERRVVIVGIGNLGRALAGYGGFSAKGFDVAALLDADPSRVGELIAGRAIRPAAQLEQVVAELGACLAVIATPGSAAQGVCDRLVASGVTCVLNFAPVLLDVPAGVDLRQVDLSLELQILSFHQAQRDPLAGLARQEAS